MSDLSQEASQDLSDEEPTPEAKENIKNTKINFVIDSLLSNNNKNTNNTNNNSSSKININNNNLKEWKTNSFLLLDKLKSSGIRKNDPRLIELNEYLISNNGYSSDIQLNSYNFKNIHTLKLLDKVVHDTLIVQSFESLKKTVLNVFNEVKRKISVENENNATLIDELKNIDKNLFSVAVCTVDGQRFEINGNEKFTLQAACKPVNYCIALDENGPSDVHSYVGYEPSGSEYNALVLKHLDNDPSNKRVPHNPLLNAGSIVCCSLIANELPFSKRFNRLLNTLRNVCGHESVEYNNTFYLSEETKSDRNLALMYLMRENNSFPENVDTKEALKLYLQSCCMEVSCDTLAVLAGTFAKLGICPITNEAIFDSSHVAKCLSIMLSSGLYDASGNWQFEVGIPAKTGFSGCIFASVPGKLGISVYSPPVDKFSRSVRGKEFIKLLVQRLSLNIFGDYNNQVWKRRESRSISQVNLNIYNSSESIVTKSPSNTVDLLPLKNDKNNNNKITIESTSFTILNKLREAGIRFDDPRLIPFLKCLEKHNGKNNDIKITEDMIINGYDNEDECIKLLKQAINDNFMISIKHFKQITKTITYVYNKVKKEVKGGKNATYIPELANVDPNLFGVAVCTIDGQRFCIGDSHHEFCAQSTSKPISYLLACKDHGLNGVHKHVSTEPSGQLFNHLSLHERDSDEKFDNNEKKCVPHNPLINSGAIMCSSLIQNDKEFSQRFKYVLEKWEEICGYEKVAFDNSVYLSESSTANRNWSLAHLMNEFNAFPDNTNIGQTLEFYFQQCSITLSCDTMAVLAATLAGFGVCPITSEILFKSQHVEKCLALMSSCGMYDYSGEWTYHCGLPGKSGVSGAIYAVVPGKLGIAVFSPPLDSRGNSVKGVQFVKQIVEALKLHHFGGFDHFIWSQTNQGDNKYGGTNVRRCDTYTNNKVYKKTDSSLFSVKAEREKSPFERFKKQSSIKFKEEQIKELVKRRLSQHKIDESQSEIKTNKVTFNENDNVTSRIEAFTYDIEDEVVETIKDKIDNSFNEASNITTGRIIPKSLNSNEIIKYCLILSLIGICILVISLVFSSKYFNKSNNSYSKSEINEIMLSIIFVSLLINLLVCIIFLIKRYYNVKFKHVRLHSRMESVEVELKSIQKEDSVTINVNNDILLSSEFPSQLLRSILNNCLINGFFLSLLYFSMFSTIKYFGADGFGFILQFIVIFYYFKEYLINSFPLNKVNYWTNLFGLILILSVYFIDLKKDKKLIGFLWSFIFIICYLINLHKLSFKLIQTNFDYNYSIHLIKYLINTLVMIIFTTIISCFNVLFYQNSNFINYFFNNKLLNSTNIILCLLLALLNIILFLYFYMSKNENNIIFRLFLIGLVSIISSFIVLFYNLMNNISNIYICLIFGCSFISINLVYKIILYNSFRD